MCHAKWVALWIGSCGLWLAGSAHGQEPATRPADSTYNVRDFGAAGDGQKDDTVSFQAALDAAGAAGGGIVLAPRGNYLIAGFKDAPLGASIQVTGILAFATAASGRSFDAGVEPYTLIGIGFLMVSLPAAWLVRRLERHLTYERT
mgnify:CR=1 FL=1